MYLQLYSYPYSSDLHPPQSRGFVFFLHKIHVDRYYPQFIIVKVFLFELCKGGCRKALGG